jgi:hypothetical protein
MDAWSDEGRVYLLDSESVPALGLMHDDGTPSGRTELNEKMVLIDAVSILLERSRFDAATALHACQLELVVAEAASYADAPVWVVLRAPADLVFTLGNLDRDTAWFVREAISESLPTGYQATEFYVQALLNPTPYGDEGLEAA